MQCPICEAETRVIDTRPSRNGAWAWWRRRECINDRLHRFNTIELPLPTLQEKGIALVALPTDQIRAMDERLVDVQEQAGEVKERAAEVRAALDSVTMLMNEYSRPRKAS